MQITVLPDKQNQVCGLIKAVRRIFLNLVARRTVSLLLSLIILHNKNCGIVMYIKGLFGGGILQLLLIH